MMTTPPSWRRTTLGDLALSVRNGIFASRPADGPGGTKILRISAVRGGRVDLGDAKFVDGLPTDKIAQFSLDEGDLLFTRYNGSRRLVGICGLVPPLSEALIHPDKLIRVIVPRGVADPKFVNYQMETVAVRSYLDPRIRTTAGQSGISGKDVRGIPLVVPGLSEQRRIVDILEDHLSHLDAAESTLTTCLRRLKSLRGANLRHVISRPDREMVPLSQLVQRIEAGRSFGGAAAPAGADEWGVVRVSAMTWGAFRANENKRVPPDAADARYEIRSGDLLLSRANTSAYVGASVLVEDVRPRLLLSDKSLRLVPTEDVAGRWLQLALSTPSARGQISAKATGTKDSMRNISQAALLSVQVPYADPVSQANDIRTLATCSDDENRLLRTLNRTRAARSGLRRALLAAAFSGQLTGRTSDLDRVEEIAGV